MAGEAGGEDKSEGGGSVNKDTKEADELPL
jgi:hypothetical protein